MGARFEISVWRPQPAYDPEGWRWEEVYYGNSRWVALRVLSKALFVKATSSNLPVRVIIR